MASRRPDGAAPRAAAARGGDPGGARVVLRDPARGPTTFGSCPSSAGARSSISAATASARPGWCSASRTACVRRSVARAWGRRRAVRRDTAVRRASSRRSSAASPPARTGSRSSAATACCSSRSRSSTPPGIVLLDGEEHCVPPGDHYRAELDDFCAAVRGEHPPLIGRAEMLGQARVLDALLRSAASGLSVSCPG